MSRDHRIGLLDLPSEIIYHIHLLALSPHLPIINIAIHRILSQPPPTFSAIYLLSLYAAFGHDEVLTRCLRHGICTVETMKEIRRIWDARRGYITPIPLKPLKPPYDDGDSFSDIGQAMESPRTPIKPKRPALKCSELPRRLFRLPLDLSNPVHPLLTYLFDTYTPSPNAPSGYPLARAVLSSNYELITFLLSKGADPGIKDNLAIEVAITKKDLKAVKLLVEARYLENVYEGDKEVDCGGRVKRRDIAKGKRRKVGERVVITQRLVEVAMRKGSRDIVQFFVHEKGVMPPLDSIMKLGFEEKLRNTKTVKATKRRRTSRA